MEFNCISQSSKRKGADVLVLPLWQGKKGAEWAADCTFIADKIQPILKSGDFKGSEGEILLLYIQGEPEKRVFLLGLGEKQKLSLESLRRSYGTLTKYCLSKKFDSLNLVVPIDDTEMLPENKLIKGLTEGLLLPNYHFMGLKTPPSKPSDAVSLLKTVHLIGLKESSNLKVVKHVLAECEAVYYARNLVNDNADRVTPEHLATSAKQLAKEYPHLKTSVFDKKRIQKEKMGLLLAVGRGSAVDPYFIVIEYKGNPKSKDHTVIVGKGVTYDTGGLNIKVNGMETMKCDMGGAAACLGTMMAIGKLQPKVNVTAVIPTTENSVNAHSFKPGDVYVGYAGKSVEVINTDAEGRLILADALAYAADKLKPSRIIDLATLTGAIEIALGSEATGLMASDDDLANSLIEVGEETGERVWRMPLYEEYKDKLKSDVADMKNWNGRSASSSVAAVFLREFVGDVPWAHLDIASTAYLSESKKYLPKYATGVGVRLLMEFLRTDHDGYRIPF